MHTEEKSHKYNKSLRLPKMSSRHRRFHFITTKLKGPISVFAEESKVPQSKSRIARSKVSQTVY